MNENLNHLETSKESLSQKFLKKGSDFIDRFVKNKVQQGLKQVNNLLSNNKISTSMAIFILGSILNVQGQNLDQQFEQWQQNPTTEVSSAVTSINKMIMENSQFSVDSADTKMSFESQSNINSTNTNQNFFEASESSMHLINNQTGDSVYSEMNFDYSKITSVDLNFDGILDVVKTEYSKNDSAGYTTMTQKIYIGENGETIDIESTPDAIILLDTREGSSKILDINNNGKIDSEDKTITDETYNQIDQTIAFLDSGEEFGTFQSKKITKEIDNFKKQSKESFDDLLQM